MLGIKGLPDIRAIYKLRLLKGCTREYEYTGNRPRVDQEKLGLIYCLKKKSFDVGQARRMVHDKNEWWRYVGRNTGGLARGMISRIGRDALVVGFHS